MAFCFQISLKTTYKRWKNISDGINNQIDLIYMKFPINVMRYKLFRSLSSPAPKISSISRYIVSKNEEEKSLNPKKWYLVGSKRKPLIFFILSSIELSSLN